MHMNHARSVSDMLVQVRADAETIHVESGLMDGQEAIIIAAVGPMARYVRRMLEAECRQVPAMQTTLELLGPRKSDGVFMLRPWGGFAQPIRDAEGKKFGESGAAKKDVTALRDALVADASDEEAAPLFVTLAERFDFDLENAAGLGPKTNYWTEEHVAKPLRRILDLADGDA